MMMRRLFQTERLKTKKTVIPFLAVIGPVGVIALTAVNFALRRDYLLPPGVDEWSVLLGEIFILLPAALLLGITLIASLLAGMEFQQNNWKQLLALPIGKSRLYASKWIVLAAYLLFSTCFLIVGTFLLGWALGFETKTPWMLVVRAALFPYVAALPIMALQWWISVNARNQAGPITIGVVGVLLSMYILPEKLKYFLIWSYPVLATPLQKSYAEPEIALSLGVIVSICFLIIGMLHFQRKEFN